MIWFGAVGFGGQPGQPNPPNSMKWLENPQIKWQKKRNLITTSTSLSVSYDINPTNPIKSRSQPSTVRSTRFFFCGLRRQIPTNKPNLKAIRSRASPNPRGKIQNSLLPRPVWFTSFLIQDLGEGNCWTMKVWWSIFSLAAWVCFRITFKNTHLYHKKKCNIHGSGGFVPRCFPTTDPWFPGWEPKTPSDHRDHPPSQPPEPSALDLPPEKEKLGSFNESSFFTKCWNGWWVHELLVDVFMYIYDIYIYICTYSYIYICVCVLFL